MHRSIHRTFASTKNVYEVGALGKNKLSGFYDKNSKSEYLNYLAKNGSSVPQFQHFKPIYNTQKALGYFGKERNSDIQISNLGIGSYLGDPTIEDDVKLFRAVEAAVNGGINLIDTAANYRYGKSERVIGAALQHLANTQGLSRSSVFLASKIGYITPDPDLHLSEADVIKQCLEFAQNYEGTHAESFRSLNESDFIAESHAIHPAYLAFQLERTLNNLNVETVDLLYLHNAAETRLAIVKKEKFFDELKRAFEYLESAREQNKLRFYGLATWNCFRAKIDEEGIYLSMQEIGELAKEVGGEANGLRFIQLPMSLIMHEAFTMKWQRVRMDNADFLNMKALEAAQYFGFNVITSAPLMQTYALQIELPFKDLGLSSSAQAHLQLMRSMPAESLKSTLVGFKSPEHIAENLALLNYPVLDNQTFNKFIMSLSMNK
jgi:aryl-alcohol dehydrogenase-like predicted oxidoreductase